MFKNGILLLILFSIGLFSGVKLAPVFQGSADTAESNAEEKPLYWVAPMDKNYRRDGPGQSPMGMDLVPVYEEESSNEPGIRISPEVENNLGVKTVPVAKETVVFPIQTVGTVVFDESRIEHVHTRVDGWIENLSVAAVGDRVEQGQVLFELYSPALVSAQEEYLAARRSKNTKLIKASASRLYALGLSRNQVNSLAKKGKVEQTVSITASRSGVVKSLNVRKGMFIKPATEVIAIADLSSVWVIGEVFEGQAGLVRQGVDVSIVSSAFPGKEWHGTVNYLYPELDTATRTLKVRVRIDNADELLRSGMLVDLALNIARSEATLTVPRSAVIKTGRHNRVVKALGEGRYQSVPIKIGYEGLSAANDNAVIEILNGLSEGESVVIAAQFLIDSESYVEAEFKRMEQQLNNPSEMAEPDKMAQEVLTKGVIEKVMPEMGMVTITHEPITEWDWPTMKMDFGFADSIEPNSFTEGATVDFILRKTGDWDYQITALGDQAVMQHSKQTQKLPQGAVKSNGIIRDVMLDMNMLQVVHEPIPEWEWPEMNMSFIVKEDEALPDLESGDQISFYLRETEEGDYEISNVRKQ
ncbi:hypothetical protein A3750_13445 [Oleiphilus sp. HI0079]|uniref:efflux RND transporter periplasmic adaptor subunit n=1 Tax=Oleiphilus sp. HI0079 TaxID=1822254 RepID=UPI0007C321B1|nr:efflux RND transporter periplasmic adaptor subunit [Oleiphilus sp. HI0079]KZZ14786.1 hypothetical protein A3750_13445 [Oleiphilus sp. HI0079]